MKTKTVYVTDDGREFESEDLAKRWENKLEHGKLLSKLYRELITPKVISLIAPFHTGRCNDETLEGDYQQQCARCVLLEAIKIGYWDENFILEVEVKNLEKK